MTDTKPTILFLHAFPLNSEMWTDQVAAFSKTHRCLTIDLPGFGKTAHPSRAFTFEHYVDFTLDFLAKSGVAKSVWCGLSMGGYLALRMFERSPEICSGLILCDTKAGADGNEAKVKRAAAIRSLYQNREEFIEGQWKALVGESSQSNKLLKDRFNKLVSQSQTEGIGGGLVALATRTDSTELLSKITAPALIVVGKEDQVTPLKEAEAMNKAIEGSKLVVIEKAGHLSNLENPKAFNEAVSSFLDVGRV